MNSSERLPGSPTMNASLHMRLCELFVAVSITVTAGTISITVNRRGVTVRIRPVNCAAVMNQKTGTVVMPTYWTGTRSSLSSRPSSRTSIPYPPDQTAAAIINHATDTAPGACLRFHSNGVNTSATTAPTKVAAATNDDVSSINMCGVISGRMPTARAVRNPLRMVRTGHSIL